MISIADLLTTITQAQARATMVSMLVTLGVPADKWRVGGPLSTLLTVVAWIYSTFSSSMVQVVSAGFLSTATSGWLTLLAFYVYGVTRPAATFASGKITLTNTGGGLYTVAPGQGTFKSSSTGAIYTNTDPINLLSLGTQANIGIVAQAAGTGSNANPGGIDTILSFGGGSPVGVLVSNPSAVAGIDALDDVSLRALCLNKLGALGVRGVRSAYFYAVQVATNAVTNGPVNINRRSVSASSHTGTVTIVVASPTGAADPNDVAGVVASVEANARPDAVTVNVVSATAVSYAPAITVYCYLPTGVTAAAAQSAIGTAITNFIAAYPIGGIVASDDLNANLSGMFADGVKAAAGAGLATVGGMLLSTQGVTDLALGANVVANDNATVNVRVLSQGVAAA